MTPDTDGEYVTYADHLAALAAKDAEIERLRTGDTCARACEGMAFRIMYQQEKARAERAEAERDKLLGCRDELREIAESINDPRLHNTITIAEWCKEAEAERDAMKALAVRWLRKWQSDMDPTPEMLDQTHALIGAALQEAER